MRNLLDKERELAADFSHRLRTPLAVLRLAAEAMPPGPIADRVRQARPPSRFRSPRRGRRAVS